MSGAQVIPEGCGGSWGGTRPSGLKSGYRLDALALSAGARCHQPGIWIKLNQNMGPSNCDTKVSPQREPFWNSDGTFDLVPDWHLHVDKQMRRSFDFAQTRGGSRNLKGCRAGK